MAQEGSSLHNLFLQYRVDNAVLEELMAHPARTPSIPSVTLPSLPAHFLLELKYDNLYMYLVWKRKKQTKQKTYWHLNNLTDLEVILKFSSYLKIAYNNVALCKKFKSLPSWFFYSLAVFALYLFFCFKHGKGRLWGYINDILCLFDGELLNKTLPNNSSLQFMKRFLQIQLKAQVFLWLYETQVKHVSEIMKNYKSI